MSAKRLRRWITILAFILVPVLVVWLLRTLWVVTTQSLEVKSLLDQPAQLAGCFAISAFLTSAVLQIRKQLGNMRAETHQAALRAWLAQRLSIPFPLMPPMMDHTRDFNKETLDEFTTEINGVRWAKPEDFLSPKKQMKKGMWWRLWWGDRMSSKYHEVVKTEIGEGYIEEAEKQIGCLCAAESDETDFYNLPTGQWCGQMARAVSLVMISPRNYPHLLAALLSGKDQSHQKAVGSFVMVKPEEWTSHGVPPSGYGSSRDDSVKKIDAEEYDRLRAAVTNHAERALDGLQIQAARKWRRDLLIAGFQISLGVSLAVSMIVAYPGGSGLPGFLKFCYVTVVCGLAGGLLAPIAHDITSALRAFGRR